MRVERVWFVFPFAPAVYGRVGALQITQGGGLDMRHRSCQLLAGPRAHVLAVCCLCRATPGRPMHLPETVMLYRAVSCPVSMRRPRPVQGDQRA